MRSDLEASRLSLKLGLPLPDDLERSPAAPTQKASKTSGYSSSSRARS